MKKSQLKQIIREVIQEGLADGMAWEKEFGQNTPNSEEQKYAGLMKGLKVSDVKFGKDSVKIIFTNGESVTFKGQNFEVKTP